MKVMQRLRLKKLLRYWTDYVIDLHDELPEEDAFKLLIDDLDKLVGMVDDTMNRVDAENTVAWTSAMGDE